MSDKALIIAIENYSKSEELARKLAGTNAAAKSFFEWVTRRKGIQAGDVWLCGKGVKLPGVVHRFPATSQGLLDALFDLIQTGQDQTEELFLFYSGHGFCFEESAHEQVTDILVASDFVTRGRSGGTCFQLGEVRSRLFLYLGGRQHYYFVDACRTVVKEKDIEPGRLGLTFPRRAQSGSPTTYMLFSTEQGAASFTDSGFSGRLIEALNGHGRAKDYDDQGRLFVQFPLVSKYVRDALTGQKPVEEKRGDGEGLILEIKPVPVYKGKIKVEGASEGDKFELVKRVRTSPRFAERETFQGPGHAFDYEPSDITIEVLHEGNALPLKQPATPNDLNFFDDGVEAVFTKSLKRAVSRGAGRGVVKEEALVTMRVVAPDRSRVRAVQMNTLKPFSTEFLANEPVSLPAGTFRMSIEDPHRRVGGKLIDIGPKTKSIELLRRPGKTRRKIIQTIGFGDSKLGSVAFSEQLDEMRDRDLSLWLTILGASRLLRDPTIFSKIRDLPLARFEAMNPGESRAYVLAGFDEPRPVSVLLQPLQEDGSPGQGKWAKAAPVAGLGGVMEEVIEAAEGTHLLSLRAGPQEPRTYVIHCLPNRVTLAVFSEDGKGTQVFHQFVLPVHHLIGQLDPAVQGRLAFDAAPLRLIRALHLAQNRFANGRSVAAEQGPDRDVWMELLYGKWVDPVMSLVACYDILRHGAKADRQMIQGIVLSNLERFFSSLPDTTAIARMLGRKRSRPKAPPLIMEGLAAFPDWEDNLPLPPRRLDYGGVWTCWRGAV